MPALIGLDSAGRRHSIEGTWVEGGPWERFGLYNSLVVVRSDARARVIPGHAGELVPGSTEDLIDALRELRCRNPLAAPMSLDLDPTYRCASLDCGGSCFSAAYRRSDPSATISADILTEVLKDFANHGGRIVRFDGGGDPLVHPSVRNGDLLLCAHGLGLKSAVLTSGDLLPRARLGEFARAQAYVRISLNASTDRVRRLVHRNHISLSSIVAATEELVKAHGVLGSAVPVAASFLLLRENLNEVASCARLARDIGVKHFSVRRVLGPAHIRPSFGPEDVDRIAEQFRTVSSMHSRDFQVAVPWRRVQQPDLDPSQGDFAASMCWQSVLKVVVEPDPTCGGARGQLCGRYRGGGVGQLMSLPDLFRTDEGKWVDAWRRSFWEYPYTRDELLGRCSSCIDRGFILLVDRLHSFLSDYSDAFEVRHLYTEEAPTIRDFEQVQIVESAFHAG